MSASDTSRVVLLGAAGLLGRAWHHLLSRGGRSFSAPSRSQLDLTLAADRNTWITADTNLVINCTGFNDVDGAETAEADAKAINSDAVGCIATRCAEVDATLLQYSTDYVFAGTSKDPYSVDARPDPVNAYGGTKAAGEAAVRASGCDFLLIRTSWLYAPWGRNFVRSIASLARERDSIRVVADQRGRPTSVYHLAEASRELLRLGARGTLHVCDAGECTWFDFAREIVRQLHLDCRVEPCTTAEFPRPAPRPVSSVLDLSRTEALLGSLPHWRKNLETVIQDLKRSTSSIGGSDHP